MIVMHIAVLSSVTIWGTRWEVLPGVEAIRRRSATRIFTLTQPFAIGGLWRLLLSRNAGRGPTPALS
jgi:hypothetical protein